MPEEPEGFAFGPFLFGEPSDEQKRQIQEAREHQHMHVMDFQHTIEDAWESLTVDQLVAIAQWMNYVSEVSGDQARIKLAYQCGSLFRLAASKSNKCIVCDKNHDEEVNALLVKPEEAEASAVYEESQRLIAEHEANVKTYRLEQDFILGGFKCKDCGMKYSSLEDRMMKEPGIEGCPGCIHKQKWG